MMALKYRILNNEPRITVRCSMQTEQTSRRAQRRKCVTAEGEKGRLGELELFET